MRRLPLAAAVHDGTTGRPLQRNESQRLAQMVDNLDRRGVNMLLGDLTEATHALGNATARSWLAMAHTGEPQHDEIVEWPQYSPSQRAVMELGLERRVLDDPGSGEREFWASLS